MVEVLNDCSKYGCITEVSASFFWCRALANCGGWAGIHSCQTISWWQTWLQIFGQIPVCWHDWHSWNPKEWAVIRKRDLYNDLCKKDYIWSGCFEDLAHRDSLLTLCGRAIRDLKLCICCCTCFDVITSAEANSRIVHHYVTACVYEHSLIAKSSPTYWQHHIPRLVLLVMFE